MAILLSLGTWQLKRLEWKNAIIEKLDADYKNAARTPVLSFTQLDDLSAQTTPLSYGSVEGRILRAGAVLLGPRTNEGHMGYHLLLPLSLQNGKTLIINTGWVNDLWKDDFEDRLAMLPQGPVTVRGVLHKPDWSGFASKNSPANDLWFRADIGEIAAAKNLKNLYPFLLYADSSRPVLHDVTYQKDAWRPRNKHLQYALFWYALAFAMLGVYGFYIRSRVRLVG